MNGPESEWPSSWTVFRLPRSHVHCHLWNFDWDSVTPRSLQSFVLDFLHQVQDGKAPHMVMTGKPGIGKSHIGVGIYRAASAIFGTELVTWINVPAFCSAVKQSYAPGEVNPWDDYMAAKRLVVLDDLFGREFTGHEKDQIITRLLDTAYINNASLVATMNQDSRELMARLPPHEISRLLSNGTVVPMTAEKDWRRV